MTTALALSSERQWAPRTLAERDARINALATALRSGCFAQTTGELYHPENESYCVMGVACRLAQLHGVPVGEIAYNNIAPEVVVEYYGFQNAVGSYNTRNKNENCLMYLNDKARIDFRSMANIVEKLRGSMFVAPGAVRDSRYTRSHEYQDNPYAYGNMHKMYDKMFDCWVPQEVVATVHDDVVVKMEYSLGEYIQVMEHKFQEEFNKMLGLKAPPPVHFNTKCKAPSVPKAAAMVKLLPMHFNSKSNWLNPYGGVAPMPVEPLEEEIGAAVG